MVALIKNTPAHRYMIASVVGLLAALIVLAYVLVKAVYAIGIAHTGLCHDPPSLTGSVSQITVVAVCVACFVAGHVVSWAGTRSRSELRDKLGQTAWSASALMALEALMLLVGIWPITYYVRCAAEANTPIAMLGAGIFTFLAGRWFWIPR